METAYLLPLVAITSATAVVVGRRVLGLGLAGLKTGVTRALELFGAALLFWGANVLLGTALALTIRALGLGFVSAYINTDLTLGVVSLAQALVFESWRTARR